VLEHVVYVAADEHRLVCLRELDAAEPRAGQQRAHPAGVGEGEGSIRLGHLARAQYRGGRGGPHGKKGFSSRVRQHRNASLPPRRSAFRGLPNAAAGSSKNIVPKLLSTTSKMPAWNGCTWASATSNLALVTPAQAASRRASG
jgi:hypothetical protein